MQDSVSYKAIGRELLRAIAEGDQCAYEAFYRMEHNNLLHFVSSYVHDAPQAEDIVQDTLLRIWQTRENLNPDGNLRALTYTIARNLALDYLRGRTDTESLDSCQYLADDSLDVLINTLDMTRLVEKTFAQLPPKIRGTFLLSRQEGLTNREIAVREKVSVKAIEYRISSALKVFRRIKENF